MHRCNELVAFALSFEVINFTSCAYSEMSKLIYFT